MSVYYTCPICSLPLSASNTKLTCENNHSFDKAKEGYFNLLPVQNKKSKDPGDNKDMVIARRAFLNRGYYQFLQDALNSAIATYGEPNSSLLDVGCGEGYYTHSFHENKTVSEVFGLDISKPAVKYAAKRFKDCRFSVASSSNAPFDPASFDLIVSVFSPLFEKELARLAKSRGKLIVASPGDTHLHELKSLIYKTVTPHSAVEAPTDFTLVAHQLHTQTVTLSLDALTELIKMTPFAWKFRPEHWDNLEEQVPFTVTLSFYVSVFERL